jgi:hypothetical protein
MRVGVGRDRVRRLDGNPDVAIKYRAIGTVERAWIQARGIYADAVAAALEATARIKERAAVIAQAKADGRDLDILAAAGGVDGLRDAERTRLASTAVSAALLRVMITGVEGIEGPDGEPLKIPTTTEEVLGVAVPLADASVIAMLVDAPELESVLGEIIREGVAALAGLGEPTGRPSESPPHSPDPQSPSDTSRADADAAI